MYNSSISKKFHRFWGNFFLTFFSKFLSLVIENGKWERDREELTFFVFFFILNLNVSTLKCEFHSCFCDEKSDFFIIVFPLKLFFFWIMYKLSVYLPIYTQKIFIYTEFILHYPICLIDLFKLIFYSCQKYFFDFHISRAFVQSSFILWVKIVYMFFFHSTYWLLFLFTLNIWYNFTSIKIMRI